MRAIIKRFGAAPEPLVVANDSVDLIVPQGELHAVVGENGAGKSTLMHILAGLQQADAGSIELFGEQLDLSTPASAIRAGVGLVAQHFALIPTFTAWENVILGAEPGSPFRLDADTAMAEVGRLADELGVHLPHDVPVERLPVALQQAAEIIKALYRKARLIILDEPTAALSPPEARRLFDIVNRLQAGGCTIILVTHRVQDVLDHAASATVLRNGRVAARFHQNDLTANGLVEAIIGNGSQSGLSDARTIRTSKSVLLQIRGLDVTAETGPALSNIELSLHSGEVLGIAGVAGNGQDTLVRAIVGDTGGGISVTAGSIDLNGRQLPSGIAARRRLGISLIPEDRLNEGIIASFAIRDNLVLGDHQRFSSPMGIRYGLLDADAENVIEQFDIRASGGLQPAGHLSGGNQQKVVVARELTREPQVVIAVQPTRGLDIRAAAFVRDRLLDVARSGGAVLLISHDLEKLMAASHRIAVLARGRIAGLLDRHAFDESVLGQLMTGEHP